MPTHSKNYWKGYVNENAGALGGGANGAVYAETEPANTAALTSASFWTNKTQKFPRKEYLQEKKKGAGMDSSEGTTFTEQTKIIPGEVEQYMQSSVWLTKSVAPFPTPGYQYVNVGGAKLNTSSTGLSTTTQYYFKIAIDGGSIVEYDIITASDVTYAAIVALMNTETKAAGAIFMVVKGNLYCISLTTGTASAISLTAGTSGTNLFATLTDYVAIVAAVAGTASDAGLIPQSSWCEIFKRGETYKGAYGCYISDYTLDVPKPEADAYVLESLVYPAYDVKDITDGNFTTQKAWLTTAAKKPQQISMIIEATSVTNFNSLTLKFVHAYTEKGGGNELHKFPYLNESEVTIDLATYDYLSAILLSMESETATLFSLVIELTGNSLIITNLKVTPESLTISEVPELGQKEYAFSLEIGGKCGVLLL